MRGKISILCTGSEILDGRIEDTNSRFLINSFEQLGIEIQEILACRDDIPAITAAVRFLLERSELLIISGGLGPTSDDLTREAVSEFLGRPLRLDAQALEDLKARYRERKRAFDGSNTKQAQFPEGAAVLKNPVGTAAGFRCTFGTAQAQRYIAVVPGVPHELRRMFADHLAPMARELFGSPALRETRTLNIFGRPEAKVGEMIEAQGVPSEISISYRAHYPQIIVKVSSSGSVTDLDAFVEQARRAVGKDFIFSEAPDQTIEQALHLALLQRKLTVATAESCTGGGIGSLLTNTPGSSAYYLGGIISYSNSAKTSLLEVPAELIARHGAVSHEVACAMAEGARKRFGSDLAVSVTGVAGPDGGSPEKPVGTFYIGLADRGKTEAFYSFASASRKMVRQFAAFSALDLLRRYALGLPLRPKDILGVPQETR